MSLYPAIRTPLVRAPKWWLVDAHGHHVGRLASQLPKLLQGKYKPSWNPSVDCGDYVVIINARHVKFTGKKWDQKYYKWHTGWVGGLKQRSAKMMLEKDPGQIMRKAITRMMKKNALRARYENRLLIYPDATHPHTDQKLFEFNPIESTNPVGIPRYDPGIDTDYSIKLTKDESTKNWTISARVFKPNQPKEVRKAAKRAGHFGRGTTRTPIDPMYPDTMMLGPALTHSEWKRTREMIQAGTKPANWPVRPHTPQVDQYVRNHIDQSLSILSDLKKNPLPKPEPTSATISWAEAQEILKGGKK